MVDGSRDLGQLSAADGVALVDLSLPLRDGGPSFPGDPPCSVTPVLTLPHDIAATHTITMGSHQATHVDAPKHFLEDGSAVDEIPLWKMVGQAWLVDLTDRPPRSMIEVSDVAVPEISAGDRLVYRLGWDRMWPSPAYFTDMPRLSIEAARWLADRRLALVGMDAPTPNPESMVEVHRLLLSAGTVLLEGLANLDRLEPGWFWLSAVPLRIEGSDGAPVRAFGSQAGA
jgi:kynurenine formamidase